MHPETLCLHAGQIPDPVTKSRAVPIYQTTSYVFDSTEHAANLFSLKETGNIYTRIMNPTTEVLEKRIAALEGGTGAVATSSGQAAITYAILNITGSGDEVVSSSSLYGGTYNLFRHTLPKMGIKVHFVDPGDPENFRRAITPRTRLLYAEVMGNPGLDVLDIEAVSSIAHENGIPLIIDNTVATPYLCRPFDYGADIVVHSTTKFIGGHGIALGGIVVDSGRFSWDGGKHPGMMEPDPSYHGLRYWETFGRYAPLGGVNVAYIMKLRLQWLRDVGASMSPFHAWLFLLGLETLHLRMERHSENALRVAQFLKTHPKVKKVVYPGLESHPTHHLAKKYFTRGLYGAIVGFELHGGVEEGRRFIDNLKLISHLANIGDAKTLAIHPASTTHAQLTEEERLSARVTPSYIRLSVGIEAYEDIEKDLKQALDKV